MKRTSLILFIAAAIVCAAITWVVQSCTSNVQASTYTETATKKLVPDSEETANIPAYINKSNDAALQTMVSELAPFFKQLNFVDPGSGKSLEYTLFTPQRIENGKNYPLVIFIADATTTGSNVMQPVSQGHGALVWATIRSQGSNPCYVLVPQFSGVVINANGKVTAEATMLELLINAVVNNHSVDVDRIYLTGQGMGGMLAMHLNAKNPRMFAASLYVDCQQPDSVIEKIAGTKFMFVTAGTDGETYQTASTLRQHAIKLGKSCPEKRWSARLSLKQQERMAADLVSDNPHCGVVAFETGTSIPHGFTGNEQLYSFDHAYQLTPLRNWLFNQHR